MPMCQGNSGYRKELGQVDSKKGQKFPSALSVKIKDCLPVWVFWEAAVEFSEQGFLVFPGISAGEKAVERFAV